MELCPTCGRVFDDGAGTCPDDSTSLSEALSGPRVFGNRYLLESRVAAGSMGIVFRARHTEIGSVVAVKLMRSPAYGLRIAIARFRREAQILGRIKHPNAILVMDFGIELRADRPIPYIVTEYLRGQALEEHLAGRTFTLEETERIVTPLANAVAEAHQLGVVHRDLKPANVFLEALRDGTRIVKVLDFGIARLLDRIPLALASDPDDGLDVLDMPTVPTATGDDIDQALLSDASLTAPDQVIGTPSYMAPEQAREGEVTGAADVYSIATILVRLLTGRCPYEGSPQSIVAQKLRGAKPSFAGLPAGMPSELEACIARCLARRPEDRPSLAELVQTLSSAVERAPGASPIEGIGRALSSIDHLLEELAAFERTEHREAAYERTRDALAAVESPLARLEAALATTDPSQEPSAIASAEAFRSKAFELSRKVRAVFGSGASGPEREYLSALAFRAMTHVRMIGRRLQRAVARPDSDPFGRDWDESLLDEMARMLESDDALDGDEALEHLSSDISDDLDAFLEAHRRTTSPLAERLVRGLARHADALLFMQRYPGPSPRRILPRIVELEQIASAEPVRALAAMFRQDRPNLGAILEPFDDTTRRVLLRAALVHDSEEARAEAFRSLEPADLWTVIAYPRTPLPILHGIFDRVKATAPPEYMKVFFLCTQGNLRSASGERDLLGAYRLLGDYFEIPCFHEDVVFEPLVELEAQTLRRGREAGIGAKLDEMKGAHISKFVAAGASPEVDPESMWGVPLPIQRRIAREGYFLPYFVAHPKEKVARETIPHLLRVEDVTPFLKLRTIHKAVLNELANHRRFFAREEARLLLLHHPKTTGRAASRYLPILGKAQLEHLVRDKNASPEVRNLAKKKL
jgi:serine/threonine protein kinase